RRIVQRYVPVPEHTGPEIETGPLMVNRCAVTCENLAQVVPKTTLPPLPFQWTVITSPLRLHFPVSCLGSALFVADSATAVTIAASTSRARTSATRRSGCLLFIMVLPSTTRFPAARRLARSAEGRLRLR